MYLADCIAKQCEWDYLCQQFLTEDLNQKFGQLLEALHVLVRHPEYYQETTRKDPDTALYEYREFLKTVRHLL